MGCTRGGSARLAVVAEGPTWSYELDEPARFVAAHGLATRLEAPTEPLGDTAWSRLVDQCARNRLTGLLVHAVATDTLPVTAAQRAAAGHLEADLVQRRIDWDRRVGPILELLDAHHVDMRVLKGMAVAQLEYPDEQMRPTSDLDVLVRPETIHRAVEVLVGAGGTWTDPEPTLGWISTVAKGATVNLGALRMEVDLHRILVWGPLGVRVQPAMLWARSRPVMIAGAERRTLEREETLLHAAAHLLVLGVVRAREVRDVAEIAANPDLDVELLLRLAAEWGQESVLASALVFAERELGLTAAADPLLSWAHTYPVPRLDDWWLRSGAAHDRIHGVEQLGVLWELGRAAHPWAARRMLLRANFRPVEGTYESPIERFRVLGRRARGRLTGERG